MTPIFHRIVELLEKHEIDFVHIQHEETLTSKDSARVRGDQLSQGAKAILYKVESEYALFIMAAHKRMNHKLIKSYFKEQGKRVKKTRFATTEELHNLTGLVPGSVPPFGHPVLNFDLYVDPSLLQNEHIAFNAGSLSDSIRMKLEDYLEIAKPVTFIFCD